MARLQILELPEGSGDDRPPFVLVVDQVPRDEPAFEALRRDLADNDIAPRIGARAVLAFEETIDIPANDTTAYLQQVAEETGATIGKIISAYTAQTLADERTDITRDMYQLAKWKQKLADALGIDRASKWDDICTTAAEFRSELIRSENARDRLRQDRDEARSWARHGYEIGQKHCGWTDRGVAPTWLTEDWPNSFDACEHLKRAAELEETEVVRKRVAAECKAALTDALGMDRTRDWDDIRNTAAGLRKQRDLQSEAIERVRQIHFKELQDDRHEDTGLCARDADDWPCSTIRAIDPNWADAQSSQPDA
jgi:hypothetical protein